MSTEVQERVQKLQAHHHRDDKWARIFYNLNEAVERSVGITADYEVQFWKLLEHASDLLRLNEASPPGSQPEAGPSDSEMLDWLAEHPYTSWGMNYVAGGWKQELRVGGNAGPRFHASNLRDAIRAAMTAAQPEGSRQDG